MRLGAMADVAMPNMHSFMSTHKSGLVQARCCYCYCACARGRGGGLQVTVWGVCSVKCENSDSGAEYERMYFPLVIHYLAAVPLPGKVHGMHHTEKNLGVRARSPGC